RDFIDYPYFADLGAVQAAAVARAAGHAVELVDALAIPGATLAAAPGGEVDLGVPASVVVDCAAGGADVVVVAMTPFHHPPSRDERLGRGVLAPLRAQHPTAAFVLADLHQGGQHVVDAPSDAVLAAYPEVDVYLRYEAEQVLPPLIQELGAAAASCPLR